jgi:4,5-dihydroxyphthalate decarboxylase
MARIPLSLACGDYEITRALADGAVEPDGIALTVLTEDKERIFRLARRNECDVAEFNVVQYLKSRERGAGLVALPIFPHRRFRHGSIFVRAEEPIASPEDLRGRSVGIGGYEPAAAIWIRGILQDQYGLKLDEVDWQDVFGLLGRLPEGQPEPADPADGASRYRIDELLLRGELAGLASAYVPPAFLDGDTRVRRLFADYKSVELAYFRETGIFPVMHVITLRAELVDRHPWIPASLTSAFSQAKRLAYDRLRNPRVLPHAFWQHAFDEQRDLLGPDPWQYGLTPGNRRAVEAVVRYCAEQGLTARQEPVDDLFVAVDTETDRQVAII